MGLPDGFFYEGWDKYGTPTPPNIDTLLLMGEWNLRNGSGDVVLVAPLSGDGDGQALRIHLFGAGEQFGLIRLLGANYARVCAGITFKWITVSAGEPFGIVYYDAGTAQFAVSINADGTFSLRRGDEDGTALATTLDAPSIGTTNCLEWDIVCHGSTGRATIYLNGVPTTIAGLTGLDLTNTANNQFSRVGLHIDHPGGNTSEITVDHFYNHFYTDPDDPDAACCLTNPVIDTDFPNEDFVLDFTPTAHVLGDATRYGSTSGTPAANSLLLMPFVATADCELANIVLVPSATSAVAKFKGVIYSDNGAGTAPDALLDTGAEVVGCTSGVTLASAMPGAVAIVKGTTYWLGFLTDTALSLQARDSSAHGYRAARTYALGPPNPAPAMTALQPQWYFRGLCIEPTEGYPQIRLNPPDSNSYNTGDTPGDREMYGFDPLTVLPDRIHGVAIKPNLRRSDAGARTVSVVVESDGAETITPAVAPSTSGEWISGYYAVDPGTGLEWEAADVNALHGGEEIVT